MALFKGKLKPADLDQELIDHTYSQLESGLTAGYGTKFKSNNSATVKELRKNIYLFSGAKTYNQLLAMNAELVNAKGQIKNFADFKADVLKINKIYNKEYLQAEYQTAKASAQMARKWNEFQTDKDLLPNILYRTIKDDRVREEHKALEGIIKPVNDPFWNTHFPPNGWRCRCSVQQTDKPVTKNDVTVKIDKAFQNNVGKTNEVFNGKHPYFSIPTKLKKEIEKRAKNVKD